jgi:hypothetical protein
MHTRTIQIFPIPNVLTALGFSFHHQIPTDFCKQAISYQLFAFQLSQEPQEIKSLATNCDIFPDTCVLNLATSQFLNKTILLTVTRTQA